MRASRCVRACRGAAGSGALACQLRTGSLRHGCFKLRRRAPSRRDAAAQGARVCGGRAPKTKLETADPEHRGLEIPDGGAGVPAPRRTGARRAGGDRRFGGRAPPRAVPCAGISRFSPPQPAAGQRRGGAAAYRHPGGPRRRVAQ